MKQGKWFVYYQEDGNIVYQQYDPFLDGDWRYPGKTEVHIKNNKIFKVS